ncbi:hypothetical protein [Actinorugispora endophytica]|uniref:Uncharacterized protein n=1 Tax=Actinorugispora endophytica TaxID=1605990 RepID=A0A4R6UVL5_9ACTN|nr:hypothetical protein [Actinorugispora endophytica]TDQ49999.1 hypothetical protein EV190_11443 [Actinorugispora endophytica]
MSGNGTPPHVEERVTVVISPDEMSADVTIQGQTRTVRGGDAKETRRAALDHAAGYATHIGRPVIIEARDAFSVQRLQALPGGVIRGLTETPPPSRPRKAPKPRGGGSGRLPVVITAVVLAVVLVAVVGIIVVRFMPDSTAAQEETGTEVETVPFDARPAPAGFSDEAIWRIPLSEGTRPAVADDGSRVAVIGADGKLAVIGADGRRTWEADLPLPVGDLQGPLRFAAAEDGFHVVAVGSAGLWIWPVEGGEPQDYELSEDAQVTFGGSGPLVTTEDGASLPVDGELVPVEAPDDTGAMLAHQSTVLMASANDAWFWAPAEGEPDRVAPAEPENAGDLDRVITASENHVVVRWESEEDDRVILAVHDADDGSVFSSTVIAAGELADARWIEGPDVAAYGPIVVDLGSGENRVLPGFSPLSAAGGTLYGELDDGQVAVGADGEPIEMDQDAARPWGLLDGHAIVLADNDLYALSPN